MRRPHLALVGAGLVAAAVFVWVGKASSSAPLPVADPIVVSEAYRTETDALAQDETLSHLFARHDITGRELLAVLEAGRPNGLNARRVRTGTEFSFRIPASTGHADEIRSRYSDQGYLVLSRDGDGAWTSRVDPIEWVTTVERVFGSIRTSLNEAIHEAVAGAVLPAEERQQLIWDTADNVFGWVIDFTRDPRPDDEFAILYERRASSDGDVRFGRVLAAQMEIQGKSYLAYMMPDENGMNRYYDETGRSLHRAFLMYPVQFRRIASSFSRRRFHPILQRYRAHLGYDFSAESGTEIRSTGDGTIRFAGRDGGYGNMVAVRHAKGIETRYAHMSRIAAGIRPGVRVSQGQLIGYVGMTGLASGPHVHYEFLKNGRQVNYREVDLGDGEPIPESMRAEFERLRRRFDRLLVLAGGEARSVDQE